MASFNTEKRSSLSKSPFVFLAHIRRIERICDIFKNSAKGGPPQLCLKPSSDGNLNTNAFRKTVTDSKTNKPIKKRVFGG